MAPVAWLKFKPNLAKASCKSCVALHNSVLAHFDFNLDQVIREALEKNQRVVRGELCRRDRKDNHCGTADDPAVIRFRIVLDY